MNQNDERAKLRTEILRLSSDVPRASFQKWGRETAAHYKTLCSEAQKLAAKGAATEQQLSGKLNELRKFWRDEPQKVTA